MYDLSPYSAYLVRTTLSDCNLPKSKELLGTREPGCLDAVEALPAGCCAWSFNRPAATMILRGHVA